MASWAKIRVHRKPGGAVGRELAHLTVLSTALFASGLFSTATRVIVLKHSDDNTPACIPLLSSHMSHSS